MKRTILVTGGDGFIGPNSALRWHATEAPRVISLDRLTCVDEPANCATVRGETRHTFVKVDIALATRLRGLGATCLCAQVFALHLKVASTDRFTTPMTSLTPTSKQLQIGRQRCANKTNVTRLEPKT